MTYDPDSSYQRGAAHRWQRSVRLECRECGVICERVVLPWRCLMDRRTCMYALEDGETTFVGCVHKVFKPELDLAALEGATEKSATVVDPYGSVRVAGSPRPQCPVKIERAYSLGTSGECCVNPEFAGRR